MYFLPALWYKSNVAPAMGVAIGARHILQHTRTAANSLLPQGLRISICEGLRDMVATEMPKRINAQSNVAMQTIPQFEERRSV
mgnify:CR=1 FL=1